MIEQTIINNLLSNEEFTRKVLPFINIDYFSDATEKQLFKIINLFVETYNRLPSKEVLNISIEKIRGLTEDQYKSLKDRIETIDVSKARLS